MLRQGLILTSQREYAQIMRQGLLSIGDEQTRVDVELDALRAMQLVPQQYDLILIDTLLDSMDGLQLLLLMKQQAPASKFIVVGDAANEIARDHAQRNGADFFLERPRNPEALQTALEAIKGLLKRHIDSQPLRADEEHPIAGIADVVKAHCLAGDSVLLLAQSQKLSGDIFIYRGEIFHAQYPGKSGETALRDMIGWDGGQLRIKALPLAHVPPRTIETPYQQLLQAAENADGINLEIRPATSKLLVIPDEVRAEAEAFSAVIEAPPREKITDTLPPDASPLPDAAPAGETPLPALNAHWKVNLMGQLVEGSQMADPDRCAFITYFIYRKLADIAVTLEVDYFDHMTLFGPHLQQVLVADNMGIRHAVFDTAWTTEEKREQFVKWCCEQSF